MPNRAIFDSVLAHSRGFSMGSLWQSLTVELSGHGVDFAKQTDMFLSLLKTQMDHGEIHLAPDGAYLEGSTGEQLDVLRRAWPKSRDELESDMGQ